MRVFGCIAYAKIPNASRTKLEPKSVKCLFLRYCEGTKAYRLINLDSKKIIQCCDVTFCEHGESHEELEPCPSGSIVDKGVLIVDTPPTPLNDKEVDDEHESDDGGDLTLLEEDGESCKADARDLEGGGAIQEQVAWQRSRDRKKKLKKPTCTTTLVEGT